MQILFFFFPSLPVPGGITQQQPARLTKQKMPTSFVCAPPSFSVSGHYFRCCCFQSCSKFLVLYFYIHVVLSSTERGKRETVGQEAKGAANRTVKGYFWLNRIWNRSFFKRNARNMVKCFFFVLEDDERNSWREKTYMGLVVFQWI